MLELAPLLSGCFLLPIQPKTTIIIAVCSRMEISVRNLKLYLNFQKPHDAPDDLTELCLHLLDGVRMHRNQIYLPK
jgi:hypothetical protein